MRSVKVHDTCMVLPKMKPALAVVPKPARGKTDEGIHWFAMRIEGTKPWTVIEAKGYQRAVIGFARSLESWTGETVIVELKYLLESFNISIYEIHRDEQGLIWGLGEDRVIFSSEARPQYA